MITCPKCDGNGVIYLNQRCDFCQNTGKVRIWIEVPPEAELNDDLRCDRQIQSQRTGCVLRLREVNLEVMVKGIK